MKYRYIPTAFAIGVSLLFILAWLYAAWSSRRTERLFQAHQSQERQRNATVLQELIANDGSARDRVIRSLLAQGFPRQDGSPPLLTVAEFFDSNRDPYTIAANLDPHPPIDAFAAALRALEQDPRVSSVRLEVVDFEDWPYVDTIYVVASMSRAQLVEKVRSLHPTEVGVAPSNRVHPGLWPIANEHTAFMLWWD